MRLLLFLFFLIPGILSAQNRTFTYNRKGKDVTMTNGETIYWFGKYVYTTDMVKEKRVQVKQGEYRIIIKINPSGAEIKTVVNSKDSVLATIYLSGKNSNAINLPDGRMLKREKSSSGNWVYKDEGKTVFSYRAKKSPDKTRNVMVEYQDRTLPNDTMEIICLEHGADFLHTNKTWLIVGVATGLALMRAVMPAGG